MWNRDSLGRRVAIGVAVAGISAVVVGVPSDVIDTEMFTRMTPVRGWEYPVLIATAALTGLWASIPGAPAARGRGRAALPSILSLLAVGCPVCNKAVVALLGLSGAMGIWAPIQPWLGVGSVALLVTAVLLRWRRRICPVPNRDADSGAGMADDSDRLAATGDRTEATPS